MKLTSSIVTFIVDLIAVNVAFWLYYVIRVESGLVGYLIHPEFYLPMFALCLYWLILLWFFGLYQHWYLKGRLDEVFTLIRATLGGCLLLFFLIVLDDANTDTPSASRSLIVGYWASLSVVLISGRLSLRTVQRRLLRKGIGALPSLIVGRTPKAVELARISRRFPELGYRIVGVVDVPGSTLPPGDDAALGYPVIGELASLPQLLEKHEIRELLVGLDTSDHEHLLQLLHLTDGSRVGVKIVPDLYDIVSGQARISSIYGVPLMDVRPEILRQWEAALKRTLDVTVAGTILLVGAPLWAILAVVVRLDSPGPALYRQERVGRFGKKFNILKFRSMFADAESRSGPVWAEKNDPRVTRVGRILRRSHLDEIPQFWNVLVGDMSLVGPRPERPVFVEQLRKEIPLYARRLNMRPGITGWAQVKHKYDESIDDVRTKVKYDLFYIENASWRFDLTILLNTLYVMIMRRGHT